MFIDPSGCLLFLRGTEEEKKIILENLQLLTHHELGIDEYGYVNIVKWNGKDDDFENGTKLLWGLIDTIEHTISIEITDENNRTEPIEQITKEYGIECGSTVFFNPDTNVKLFVFNPDTDELDSQKCPAHIALAHELIHAYRVMKGQYVPLRKREYEIKTITFQYTNIFGKTVYKTGTDTVYFSMEEYFVIGIKYLSRSNFITENMIREEQGLWLRAAYISA